MLRLVAAFWRQPCRPYRTFQIVFTILSLNFILPALSYSFSPETAVRSFLDVNRFLGGAEYAFPEAQSRVWRYLGAANVMTLGLMCVLLQLDLRRFFVVVLPLAFLKGYAAVSFLAGWLAAPGYRFLLAAAALDFVTVGVIVFFARRARRAMESVDAAALVPRPLASAR